MNSTTSNIVRSKSRTRTRTSNGRAISRMSQARLDYLKEIKNFRRIERENYTIEHATYTSDIYSIKNETISSIKGKFRDIKKIFLPKHFNKCVKFPTIKDEQNTQFDLKVTNSNIELPQEEPLYIHIRITYYDKKLNDTITITRHAFKNITLSNNQSDVYDIVDGDLCVPAVNKITVKIYNDNNNELTLTQPIKIIRKYFANISPIVYDKSGQMININNSEEYDLYCTDIILDNNRPRILANLIL
jgi:hypothetical protein